MSKFTGLKEGDLLTPITINANQRNITFGTQYPIIRLIGDFNNPWGFVVKNDKGKDARFDKTSTTLFRLVSEPPIVNPLPEPNKWVHPKSWDEFRKSGLFMFVNTLLHAFGWALVCDVDYDKKTKTELGPVKSVYPARVKYRGFDNESQTEMHKKIGVYLKENANQLQKETQL